MNFNRRDSLKLEEVLNDPQLFQFLRKWELIRQPSLINVLFNRRKFMKTFLSS